MENAQSSLERRIDQLAHDLRLLTARVDELDGRRARFGIAPDVEADPDWADAPQLPTPATLFKQITGATLLSSIATVCFLLAIALVLRTLVDSNVIDRTIGAYVGLSYAVGLIAYGYHRYTQFRRPIPIYTFCGLVMLFAIILEIRIRFQVIPANFAYLLLAATMVASAIFGLRHRVPSVLGFGIVGAACAGLALEFPRSDYSWLAPLVLLGVLVAYCAAGVRQWRWVPWTMLGFEGIFWLLWMLKAKSMLVKPDIVGHPSTITWYLPAVGAFFMVHVAAAIFGSIRARWPLGHYERITPALVSVATFGLAWTYLDASHRPVDLLGLTAVVVAVGFSCIGMWLSTREPDRAGAAPAWTASMLPLLAIGAPAAFHHMPLILMLWCSVALGSDFLGDRWNSKFLRGAAWAFQIFTCAIAVASGVVFAVTPLDPVRLVSLAVVAAISLSHYRRCKEPPVTSNVDSNSNLRMAGSLVVMFCALLYVFGAFRSLLFSLLSISPLEVDHTFQCGQSMMIHSTALLMAIFALIRREKPVILAAALIAVIGATKLFGYDLMHCQGLPLVINVSLFGVTAAIGSIVWKRWQRDERVVAGETVRFPSEEALDRLARR